MQTNLRIPGPTTLPDSVRKVMSRQMINHRGAEFSEIFKDTTARLQRLHKTKNDVLIFPGSGTGAMEATIQNLFSPGDKVLAVTIGSFGDIFANCAKAFGLDVDVLSFPPGQAAKAEVIGERLRANPDIKAVLVTHNETSTGVTNHLEKIAWVVKGAGKLLLVDAVSAIGGIDLRTDEWGCDIVLSGAQKAWMAPPGLAIIAVSEAAWEAHKTSTLPRYYWNFDPAKAWAESGQTPYTPAIANIFAIQEALKMIEEEGLENVFLRHAMVAQKTRDAVRKAGFELFADPAHASNTVTAVKMPQGINPADVLGLLNDDYNIILAGGIGAQKSEIVRIGHLGWFTEDEVLESVHALDAVVKRLRKG